MPREWPLVSNSSPHRHLLRSQPGIWNRMVPNSRFHNCYLLLRLIPLVQPGLRLLAGLLGGGGAVDHTRAQAPQLVLQVRLAPREDLVRVTYGRLAFAAPAQEHVGQRVF